MIKAHLHAGCSSIQREGEGNLHLVNDGIHKMGRYLHRCIGMMSYIMNPRSEKIYIIYSLRIKFKNFSFFSSYIIITYVSLLLKLSTIIALSRCIGII